jgi:fibronectin type 3 domain-containing protein
VVVGGTGSGSVTSTPAGIDCGATCVAVFETGASVTLTAVPGAGSILEAWSGCGSSAATTCTVALSAPASVTATFAPELPGAPGVPTYTDVTATSLTVSWSSGAFATAHDLERALDLGGTPGAYALVSGSASSPHQDLGRAPNTTYWYRVRGTNAAGASDYGSASSVTTLPAAPGGPTFSSVTASSVTVSWTAPAGGADAYELERSTSAGTDWASVATAVTGSSHVDTTVVAGTTYLYRVRATASAGAGAYSATGTVTTLPLPPDAPAAPTYSAIGASALTVSWGAVAGATTYLLERGTSASGPWTSAWPGLTATTQVDATVSANTSFWYRVRASNGGGDGASSSTSSVTTLPGAPGTPTFSAVTASSVTVSWSAPAGGADAYELERATSAGFDWAPIATAVTGLSHADATVAAGTTYLYRVRATASVRTGAYSASATVTTLPLPPGAPAAPIYAAIGASSLTVSWAAVAGATSYLLERGTSASGPWTPSWTGLTATSQIDATVSANTTFWYRVRASNTGGDGAFSSASSVTTLPGVPGAPTFTSVTASSVTVSWTAPALGATSYTLERGTSATGPWTQLAAGVTGLSQTDGALSANTTYWYQVRASNGTGDGAYSSASSVTAAPSAPGTPTFTLVTTTSLTVSWTAPPGGAASYDVERATIAAGPFSPIATTVTGLSRPDSGLVPGTTYWYRVRANTGGGAAGAYSVSASATTLPAAPSAPTFSNVAATSVTVSWAPVAGATSYKVERATAAAGPWTQIAAGSALTQPSGGLTGNTTYWYRVIATNASGDGPASAASFVTMLPGTPGAPTFGSLTTTSLVVSWSAPAGGAQSYEVQRGTGSTGPWTSVATVTGLSAPDSGLGVGTSYWYQVRAVGSAGTSAYSAASQTFTLPGVPGGPTFTNIAVTSVTVSWTGALGAASYKLERAPDNGANAPGAWAQLAGGITATTFDNTTGLLANGRYWYRVRATNPSGDGAYSIVASVTMLPNPPGVPKFTNVTTTSLTVSWTAPAGGAASYDLDRGGSSTGPWTPLAAATTSLAYADSGLTAGTTYWYRVRALNSVGLFTVYSTSSAPTLPSAPAAPGFTSIGATSLTASWSAVTGATSYKVERAPDVTGGPGAWAQIAAAVTLTTFADTGLTANTTYWYRLRATNASGDGAYSSPASVMTLPTPPGKPTFSLVTTTSLTVSWTAPPQGATSYELERAPSATGTWTPVASGSAALSHAEAGLSAGTTYWYRVRAINATGGPSAWSAASSVITLPEAPEAPTFSEISTVSLKVLWTTVTGATMYHLERAPDAAGTPGTWEPAPIAIVTDTYFNDIAAPNTRQWYRVRAWNASGYGAYSTASSVVSLANPPGAPTFTNVSSTGVTVSWTVPVGNASSYVVERAQAAGGPWTVITTAVTVLSYADSELSPLTTYWYRIRATNSAGATGWPSSIAAVTTLPAAPSGAPGAPTFSSVGTTSATIAWTDSTGATSYKLERAPDAGGVQGAWTQIATSSTRSFADTGLSANTRYWYRVRGSTAGGDSPYSAPTSMVTLPDAPGAPTFASIAVTSAIVTWTAPATGAAGYLLERGPSAVGPWGTPIQVTGLTYPETGLTAGTTNWYRVRATNAAGAAGAASPSASVTTLTATPGGPAYLNVAVTSLTVAWSGTAGAAGYRLERSAGSTGTWSQIGGAITGTSYLDAGVAANTTYWYRVAAMNASGVPGAYSAATTTTTLPGAPGAPTFVAVAPAEVMVSWAPPSGGAATYKIERAPAATGPWAQRASGVAGTVYVDTGLTANTTYFYRVRGTNVLNRDGAYSALASVTTSPDASTPAPGTPAAPTYSSITASWVRVGWAASSGATTYALERAADSGGAPAPSWGLVARITSLAYLDSGRTANVRYWYRVRASNAGGDSASSAASSVTTAPNAPGAPTFTSVAPTALTVSWTAPAGGAASYELQRATSSIGPWISTTLTATSRGDTGLTGSTLYYYRVRATNAMGVSGLFSATRTIATPLDTTLPPPGIPGAPTFTRIAASSVTVSWGAATGATSYGLERAVTSIGPWAQIAALGVTSFTDTGRTANTSFWYRVRAANGGGTGSYSAERSVITLPNAPGAPTFTSVSPTAVTVGWTPPLGGAASYKVERATSAVGPWTQVGGGITETSFVSSSLAGNTLYHYRIRATNSALLDGLASAARSVTTLPDPSTVAPGLPGSPTYSSITSTYVRVSWTAATAATSHELERAPALDGTWTRIAVTTATSFTDVGRTANTPYWYRVRGSNGGGPGPYSLATSVVTAPNAPGAPTFTSVSVNGLTVSWTAPTGGAAGYKLERATSTSGPWIQIATGISSLTHADTGLVGNTTYQYRVRATSASGADGVASAIRAVTTAPESGIPVPGAPGTPTFSNVATTYLKVSWTPATGATSYALERAPDAGGSAGAWTPIVALTATSFTDAGRTANTRYWYRVRGVNSGGAGASSGADAVMTVPNAPGGPTFTALSATGVTVSWTAPAGGAASYTLDRARSSIGPWTAIAPGVTSLTYPDAGLSPSTLYYYRVRAVNADGASGASSVIRPLTTLAAPGT